MSVTTGTSGNDSLVGTAGDDTLTGGAGSDTLDGGLGTDDASYVGSMAGYRFGLDTSNNITVTDINLVDGNDGRDVLIGIDRITFSSGTVSISVAAGIPYQLTGDGFSNAIAWFGSAGIQIFGDAGDDTLSGGGADDLLDGGLGADSMSGGSGNDTYVVDNSADIVSEILSGGLDSIQSSVDFTIPENIEILNLTGIENLIAYGSSGADSITGNNGGNRLYGNSGSDTLSGTGGMDTLVGGVGDDLFVIDSDNDVCVEDQGEGIDSIQAFLSYTLPGNIENLVLESGAAIGRGNDLENEIYGNDQSNILHGAGGNDTLIGGDGEDSLVGGSGGDLLKGGQGIDSALYSRSMSGYRFGVDGLGRVTVTDLDMSDGGDGLDVLDNIEFITFVEGSVSITNYPARLVNTTTYGSQVVGAMTSFPGGGYVVCWTSYTPQSSISSDVYFQLFDASGAPIGVETRVNSTDLGEQGGPSVVALHNGDFVVTWTSIAQDETGSNGVYSRRFNESGVAISGEERVNSVTMGDQSNSAVASLVDGGYVVTWVSGGQDGSGSGIYAQRFDADRNAIDGEFRVNTTTAGDQHTPEIAGLKDGGFVVVWSGSGAHESSPNVYLQRYDWTGAPVGSETLVNTSTAYTQFDASVSSLSDGGYVVAWFSNSPDGDISGSVYFQRYDSSGNPAGSETRGNTTVIGYQYQVFVTGTIDGGFVLTWTSEGDYDRYLGAERDVYQQIYDSSGMPVGGEIHVTDGPGRSYSGPIVSSLPDGAYVIAWTSGNTDGFWEGVYAQQFGPVANEMRLRGDSTDNTILWSGSESVDISGDLGSDSLGGGDGVDLLAGDGGNDTLQGGMSRDRLLGGDGFDSASYSDATSSVQVSLSRTSANPDELDSVENLIGSSFADTLTGDSNPNLLDGGEGADTLEGSLGEDTLAGGPGDDTFVLDDLTDTVVELFSEGTDLIIATVNVTLVSNVESLLLTGSTALNGSGNELANRMEGNAADNVLAGESGDDTLDGGAGADTLTGGAGDDTFILDDAGDVLIENDGEGTDTVASSLSHTLGAAFEKLTLTGAAVSGVGNALANAITGNAASNALDGGAGNDTLAGGGGSDTYIVDSAGDVIEESVSEGTDTVTAAVSYTLAANVEHMTLSGTAAISATGNELANRLGGNLANNTLDGGAGADTLAGGAGNDTYRLDDAQDVVNELADQGVDAVISGVSHVLSANVENLTLAGVLAINATGNGLANTLTGNGGNNLLSGGAGADTLAGGAGDDTYVVDDSGDRVTETSDSGADVVRSSVDFTLAANLESLVLTGSATLAGVGNNLANALTGNAAANRLDGATGADTLVGAGGDDTYVVDNIGDVVTEQSAGGADEVQSSVSHTLALNVEHLVLSGSLSIAGTGNAQGNRITGNAGNNTLDGATGADTLAGGTGNDTYLVDVTTDVVTEVAGAGIDLVQSSVDWTLSLNVEKLLLLDGAVSGAGNTQNNTLTGNALSNVLTGLEGNDTLVGAGAGDTLIGGLGNDTYLANLGDQLIEAAGEGTDTVKSNIAWTLGAELENLSLGGPGNIGGTGNDLGNLIRGNDGNNRLQGLGGADTLIGGLGADLLEGGLQSDNLTGGVGADRLVGGDGNDALIGGADNDTLTGGKGIDAFVFESALSAATNLDTVVDFAAGVDKLRLDDDVFTAFTVGVALTASQFVLGAGITAAQTTDQRIAYNTTTGALYYDADGAGGVGAVQFAVLGSTTHPALSAGDFVIVG